MMLIFEIVFDCLINQLLANPKDFMVLLPPNVNLLKYNIRHIGSVLFKLFEDWIIQNIPIDKRSPDRPLPRLSFFSLGTCRSSRQTARAVAAVHRRSARKAGLEEQSLRLRRRDTERPLDRPAELLRDQRLRDPRRDPRHAAGATVQHLLPSVASTTSS